MKYIGFKHQRENKQNNDKHTIIAIKIIKIIGDVFFKTRGRFSVISHLRASPFDEMTEKRPLVLQNIVNHLLFNISTTNMS
jgi:hypothetical protein